MCMSKSCLNKVKNYLQNEQLISAQSFAEYSTIFLDALGYSKDIWRLKLDNEKYGIEIENKVLLRSYKDEKFEKAIRQLTEEIDNNSFEWGILIHQKGIWLLNRDIDVANEDFKSQKIVLEIIFNKNSDTKYLKYFEYKNLLGEGKNTYFFRDFIIYKNNEYKAEEKSWVAYHSALKRFFDFYVNKEGNYYHNNLMSYDDITLSHLERYFKESKKIKSLKTVRNTFFYIKDFMIHRTNSGEFSIGSGEIVRRLANVMLEKTTDDADIDIEKCRRILDFFKTRRNSTRNEVLFLLLLSYGRERRKMCSLEWNNFSLSNDGNMVFVSNDKEFPVPTILAEKLKKLKKEQPDTAKYVLGNGRTNCHKPLPENSINGMLFGIESIDPQDSFYQNLTPQRIRKWLLKYLLKNGYSLQDIMGLMEISVLNLGNYISDEEISYLNKVPVLDGNKNVHPMEEFLNVY